MKKKKTKRRTLTEHVNSEDFVLLQTRHFTGIEKLYLIQTTVKGTIIIIIIMLIHLSMGINQSTYARSGLSGSG